MLPASNRGVGENTSAPDVCLTAPPVPPAPMPYTNHAYNCTAATFSPVVYICMVNALNLASTMPTTYGDEPGEVNPLHMDPGFFTMGNPIVYVDMLPAINLTCPAIGNGGNVAGAALVPSAVNVFYCYAAEPASLDDAPAPEGSMLEEGIGCLRIEAFTSDLSTRVYNEIQRLEAAGMRALIIDLRGCPGGAMDAFLRLAEDFVPAGAILAKIVDGDGDEEVYRSRRERPYSMPLAVLVDRWTASAAELFAACLKAHGRAVLVGETTYGKPTVHRVVTAPDGVSALYATVARCELPGLEAPEGGGVRPDVAAPGEVAVAVAAALLR